MPGTATPQGKRSLLTLIQSVKWYRVLPILNGIETTTPASRSQAVGEALVTAVFALLPSIIAFVIFLVNADPNKGTLPSFFASVVSHGELFIYSTAMLAPAYYATSADTGIIPNRWAFSNFIIALMMLFAVFFALQRTTFDFQFAWFVSLSLISFLLSTLIMFAVSAFRRSSPVDAAIRTTEAEERKFQRDFNEQMGGHA